MNAKSSESKSRSKLLPTTPANYRPDKPYAGFPMFAHAGSGQWAKKIRGRLLYFGSWRTDLEGTAALERFNHEWPHRKEGRIPPPIDVADGCTLRTLCNKFLEFKEDRLDTGELSPRSFRDYFKTCERLIEHFGRDRRVDDLRPDDFRIFRSKLAKRLGPVSLKNEINRCRIVFNFAHKFELIERPVSDAGFERPSDEAIQRERFRNAAGEKLFERGEVLRVLAAADVQLKAMILLGVNCGFGNTDVAMLPQSAVNLETGWVNFPRPKTMVPRRIPLWPETVDAIKTALAVRPAPADDPAKPLVFLTRLGRPWIRLQKVKPAAEREADEKAGPGTFISIDALSQAFGKLLHTLGINGRRGLNFYALRHCFETYGGESTDQVAVDAIMGHKDNSMAANYRHRISDERLRAVVETVRTWLFGSATEQNAEGGAK